MEEESKAIRRAGRESWATYMPTPVICFSGVVAALAVMLSPFVLYFVVAVVAVFGELIRQGWVDLYATVYVNMRSFAHYVVIEWPYILAGGALGLPLALLRQRRGFYARQVRGNQYRYAANEADSNVGEAASGVYKRKAMLPVYPHQLVLYLAGPVVLLGMAHRADPQVYPEILYNMFAVWLTSGLVARLVWEWLQVALLQLAGRRLGGPRRNLSAEFQLKRLVENDPALSYFSVWDVAVDVRQRHATVYGNIRGDGALRRLKELVKYIEGVDTIEVISGQPTGLRLATRMGRSL